MNILSGIKNYAHIIVVICICFVLWGLNARNGQLTDTVQRLEQLADSKDAQIRNLREQNNSLSADLKHIAEQVQHNNSIIAKAEEEKAKSEKATRAILEGIKRTLESDPHAAAAVPADAVKQLRQAERAAGGISAQ
ncbi:Rz lytic protein [Enterobacteriaceae bacterium LUAb1]